MTFAGLRVAIGGAGQGVGAACARLLAAQGADLLLCARSQEDLDALVASLRAAHPAARIASVAADLGSEAGADAFAVAAHEALGGLDAGLICAGIPQRPQLLLEQSGAQLAAQLHGNTVAPALAMLALARAWESAAPPQREPGRGARQPGAPDRQLLVISSLVTRRPAQLGLGPYLAAKSALEALVRTLAEELWPRVRVNALCLGPVATRMHEQVGTPPEVMARFATPAEIAPLVLELLGAPEGAARGLVTGQAGISGRCIDAEAFATDPAAALWGDGRLAQLPPLQPPPSLAHDEHPELLGEEPGDPHGARSSAPPEAEPGRPPSPRVRRALRATASSLQRYPQEANRLARRLAALHRVDADCVLLSGGGATGLLEQALHALGSSGDELLSPFPTFEVVSALASRVGLRHRTVLARRAPDGLFEPHRARELLAAVGPRTRAVYLATPDNPTGVTLPPVEEEALRRGLGPRSALILDEAWSLEIPGDASDALGAGPLTGASGAAAPLLRLRSLSKLHGLAGLRVGYALASPELASLLRRLELPFPLGAPQIAAALAALDELPRARRIALLMKRKRARLAQGIRALGLLASEGESPLLLVRDPRPGKSAGPLLFALRAAEVAAQEAHWDPAALTVSVGTPAQDRRALAALARALDVARG